MRFGRTGEEQACLKQQRLDISRAGYLFIHVCEEEGVRDGGEGLGGEGARIQKGKMQEETKAILVDGINVQR